MDVYEACFYMLFHHLQFTALFRYTLFLVIQFYILIIFIHAFCIFLIAFCTNFTLYDGVNVIYTWFINTIYEIIRLFNMERLNNISNNEVLLVFFILSPFSSKQIMKNYCLHCSSLIIEIAHAEQDKRVLKKKILESI